MCSSWCGGLSLRHRRRRRHGRHAHAGRAHARPAAEQAHGGPDGLMRADATFCKGLVRLQGSALTTQTRRFLKLEHVGVCRLFVWMHQPHQLQLHSTDRGVGRQLPIIYRALTWIQINLQQWHLLPLSPASVLDMALCSAWPRHAPFRGVVHWPASRRAHTNARHRNKRCARAPWLTLRRAIVGALRRAP